MFESSGAVTASPSIEVTIRRIAGSMLLGPEVMPAPITVADVKRRALRFCEGPCNIRLLQGSLELLNDAQLNEGPMELTAVLELLEPIGVSELAVCQRALARYFGRAVEIFAGLNDAARADRKVVELAVNQSVDALAHAHPWVLTDKDFLLKLLRKNGNGCALQYVHPVMREDKELVMAAVSSHPEALQFANKFVCDRQVVLCAVVFCGRALRFASEELRADREVVMTAVRQNGYALEYAHVSLRSDREVVLCAVQRNGGALRFAGEPFVVDREIVTAAVSQDCNALRHASKNLRNDPYLRRLAN